MSVQTVGSMTDRGTGKDTDRSGSTEDDPDLFCVQAAFPKQSWQEGDCKPPRLPFIFAGLGSLLMAWMLAGLMGHLANVTVRGGLIARFSCGPDSC